jgi:uncharacterized protein (DUF305 family)
MKHYAAFALALGLLAAPALAQTSMAEMDHGEHGAKAPMTGYMTAMDIMAQSMDGMVSSGDADADFLLMMIPHHQSAIDMALVELEHGDDEPTRILAQQIIDAQEREIAEMKEMLRQLGVEPSQ